MVNTNFLILTWPLKSLGKQTRGADPVLPQSVAKLLLAWWKAKSESKYKEIEYYHFLQPDLADHTTNKDLKRWERNKLERINCFKTKTHVLHDLERICPGQKRAGFDLTFVLYLVLQTSASLITNCTLVVIISNHMMLFYMWHSQNQKNMGQWKHSINVISGCYIQPLCDFLSFPIFSQCRRIPFPFFFQETCFNQSDSLVTDFLLVKVVTGDVYRLANEEGCLTTTEGNLKASPTLKLKRTNPDTQQRQQNKAQLKL